LFDNFFASILDSISNSFWIRLGVVLGSFRNPFGSPNRVKLDQRCILSDDLCENDNDHADLRFPMLLSFLTPRRAQDPLKTGPRRVQERQQFMHISSCFLNRLGVGLGVVLAHILAAKIDPRPCRQLTGDGLVLDLVIGCFQDDSNTVPKGAPGEHLGAIFWPQTIPRASEEVPGAPRGLKTHLRPSEECAKRLQDRL